MLLDTERFLFMIPLVRSGYDLFICFLFLDLKLSEDRNI